MLNLYQVSKVTHNIRNKPYRNLLHFPIYFTLLKAQMVNSLSANPTKWSNTLKQFVAKTDELFECVRPFCRVRSSKAQNGILF